MTTLLTTEDKLNILNQHIKNIEYATYGLQLDILEYEASDEIEASYLAKLNARLVDLNAKKAVLDAEKDALNGTATGA
jgi:hypothetical protein